MRAVIHVGVKVAILLLLKLSEVSPVHPDPLNEVSWLPLALSVVRPDHPVLTSAVLRALLLILSVLSVLMAVGSAVKPFPDISR